MVKAKCRLCGSRVGLVWQVVPFTDRYVIRSMCSEHVNTFGFAEYSKEESTFNTLEEAQVALIKRSL